MVLLLLLLIRNYCDEFSVSAHLTDETDEQRLLKRVRKQVLEEHNHDFLDWGGSDSAFTKFYENYFVDYRIRHGIRVLFSNDKHKNHTSKILRPANNRTTVIFSGLGICNYVRAYKEGYLEIVDRMPIAFIGGGENWGMFSSNKANRTAHWNYWNTDCLGKKIPASRVPGPQEDYSYVIWNETDPDTKDLINQSIQQVILFLNLPNVKLIITTQHVIGIAHPKIISIPLGIRPGNKQSITNMIMFATSNHPIPRKRLLLINNSGWRFRSIINEQVIHNFLLSFGEDTHQILPYNLYCVRNNCPHPSLYKDATNFQQVSKLRRQANSSNVHDLSLFPYGQIITSKFVLCPQGLGWDSYRIWETLYLGAIPIMERSYGKWDELFNHLPVLFVDHFSQVTPALLESSYRHIMNLTYSYDYRILTKKYWFRRFRTYAGIIPHKLRRHRYL
mmetsp:Transcript_16062/g.24090  ORF Transcript_16062/g.24090 Transcript_16062/m.24090 type:complete len:446 (-) Transcript_16062:91-1428(-)